MIPFISVFITLSRIIQRRSSVLSFRNSIKFCCWSTYRVLILMRLCWTMKNIFYNQNWTRLKTKCLYVILLDLFVPYNSELGYSNREMIFQSVGIVQHKIHIKTHCYHFCYRENISFMIAIIILKLLMES